MPLPFVVVEAGPAALEDARGELVSRDWDVHSSRLLGGPGTVWVTTVADSVATSEAVLAAVAGFGLLVDAVAERGVLDPFCDDLRRLGVLDHRVHARAALLGADEHALLRLLSGSATLGDSRDLVREMVARCRELRLTRWELCFETCELTAAAYCGDLRHVVVEGTRLLSEPLPPIDRYDTLASLGCAHAELGELELALQCAELQGHDSHVAGCHQVRGTAYLFAGQADRAADQRGDFEASGPHDFMRTDAAHIWAWAAYDDGRAQPERPLLADPGLLAGVAAELDGIAALASGDGAGRRRTHRRGDRSQAGHRPPNRADPDRQCPAQAGCPHSRPARRDARGGGVRAQLMPTPHRQATMGCQGLGVGRATIPRAASAPSPRAAPGWCPRRSGWSWPHPWPTPSDLRFLRGRVTQSHIAHSSACRLVRTGAGSDCPASGRATRVRDMTDQIPAPASGCCQHYPNRVLRKRDLARELGVCDKTIDNLVEGGKLPQPCSLNSIAVWMLYDVHDFISAASKALTSARDRESTKEATSSEGTQDTKKAKKPAHKAGKYSV